MFPSYSWYTPVGVRWQSTALIQAMAWRPGYFHLATQASQNSLLPASCLEGRKSICREGIFTLTCLRVERIQTFFNFPPAEIRHITPPRYMRAKKYSKAHGYFVSTLSCILRKNRIISIGKGERQNSRYS